MFETFLRWLIVTLFLPMVSAPATPLDPDSLLAQPDTFKPSWSNYGYVEDADGDSRAVTYTFAFWTQERWYAMIPEDYKRQWLTVPDEDTPSLTRIDFACRPTEIAYLFAYLGDEQVFTWEFVDEGVGKTYPHLWYYSFPDLPQTPAWAWFYFTPVQDQQVTGLRWQQSIPILLSGCMQRPEGSPRSLGKPEGL